MDMRVGLVSRAVTGCLAGRGHEIAKGMVPVNLLLLPLNALCSLDLTQTDIMDIATRDWERRGLQPPQDKASPQELVVADSALVRAAVATESSGAHLAQDQCIVLRNLESSWRAEAERIQFGELVESYVGLTYNEQVLHNKVLAKNHVIRTERNRKQKLQHGLLQENSCR